MKRKTETIWLAGILCSAVAMGQNQYDALRLMDRELNGTARFVGMGGAMSALGADLSTISTNPAGIGLFRGNDIALTFGLNNNCSTSDFSGSVMKENRTKASFDQIGIVWSSKIGNRTNMRYVNIAFNYHKRANFNRQFLSKGNLNGNSLTWQMADMLWRAGDGHGTYYNTMKDMDDLIAARNPYTDKYFYGTPYLASMGVRTGLVDATITPVYDEEGNIIADQSTITNIYGWNGKTGEYYSREEGGINEYDFNLSFNYRDRFYFGATLGVYDINYSRYSSYGETMNRTLAAEDGGMLHDSGNFILNNYYETEGVGFDLNLGAIVRPFEYSPFRIGFAVHTPIWYSLTDSYFSTLDTYLNKQGLQSESYRENLSQYLVGGNYVWNYALTTPWCLNVSMGTVIGGIMALDAEYEFEKYSSATLKDVDGNELNGTVAIDETLKGIHTFRAGIETKLTSMFSVRAGYQFRSTPISEDSFKNIPETDETRTDTEYWNLKSRQDISVGLGYRGKYLYVDLAYKYDFYKADFYAFDGGVDELNNQLLFPTKVDNKRHQLLMTVGVHF